MLCSQDSVGILKSFSEALAFLFATLWKRHSCNMASPALKSMYTLHPCLLRTSCICIWDIVLPPDFLGLSQAAEEEMVKSLGMTLVYCPCLTCIYEGWQYNSIVVFQLSVKSDSIPLPDISAKCKVCQMSHSEKYSYSVTCDVRQITPVHNLSLPLISQDTTVWLSIF